MQNVCICTCQIFFLYFNIVLALLNIQWIPLQYHIFCEQYFLAVCVFQVRVKMALSEATMVKKYRMLFNTPTQTHTWNLECF